MVVGTEGTVTVAVTGGLGTVTVAVAMGVVCAASSGGIVTVTIDVYKRQGWVRFLTLGWVLVACSCGARTELGGVIVGSDGGQACNAVPWVVFDYEGEQGSGVAAIRADGSSFHLLDLGGMHGWNPSTQPAAGLQPTSHLSLIHI